MGLVTRHYSQTKFVEHEPVAQDGGWESPSISYEYTVDVAFDPAAPKPRAPKQEENWRVGIVQNQLFRSVRIVYADKGPISTKWQKPLLDRTKSGGKTARPFYGPPVPVELPMVVEGIKKTAKLLGIPVGRRHFWT